MREMAGMISGMPAEVTEMVAITIVATIMVTTTMMAIIRHLFPRRAPSMARPLDTKTPSNILRHSHITPDISKTLPIDCFGVFEGVSGCWMVYRWLRGVSESLFPSFAFNCKKSQI